MEKSCDKIKRSGKTLGQRKEEYKNLQIYLIKELCDFDWCSRMDTLWCDNCWKNLTLTEILLKNIGMEIKHSIVYLLKSKLQSQAIRII